MRTRVTGSVVGVLAALALGGAMLPLRSHLSLATIALVFVIPVVAGVVIGGRRSGLISLAGGFLVYNLAFIPPYWTLAVNQAQHWAVLVVYVVIMLIVTEVVVRLEEARAAAQTREDNARHLFEMSEVLLGDKSIPELADAIVQEMCLAFGLEGAALLVPVEGRLEVIASSGMPFADEAMTSLQPSERPPVALSTSTSTASIQTLALSAAGRPIGLMLLHGVPDDSVGREHLPTVANHLALALERAELRERVHRVELLEEIDRLRDAMLGAVSHDLRTPLATIKIASSTLLGPSSSLAPEDVDELHLLIDVQADRLTRLVNNLLDMTRIRTGVLEVRRQPSSLLDLVTSVTADIAPMLEGRHVTVDIPDDLPLVEVDHVLVEQVLSNLIDNAHRHSPDGGLIVIAAERRGSDHVVVTVTDHGSGVPRSERNAVFETFVRFDTGGRAGLGLAIAKAFIEAHDETIWVEDPPGGGARFAFTLPISHELPVGHGVHERSA
jgi:two-component system, OmpR family, sensor histidine kinase KdpD